MMNLANKIASKLVDVAALMNLIEKLNLLVAILVLFRAYCFATTVPFECGIFQFMCDDGQCIKNYKLCDGQKDCIDESDELYCIPENETLTPCSEDYFRCVDRERCISFARSRCNGVPDCQDGSDELNCTVSMCRKGAEFECLWSKQCIPLSKRCDKKIDCEDESDERNCGKHRWTFSASHFPCQDFISIPRIWHCDGENDCGDNADEENCEGKKKSCPNNYCMQNATCMFIKGQYYCNCPTSFTGKKCERKISDERDSNNLGVVIGTIVALIILFINIACIFFYYCKR